jgi:hypothetical protein
LPEPKIQRHRLAPEVRPGSILKHAAEIIASEGTAVTMMIGSIEAVRKSFTTRFKTGKKPYVIPQNFLPVISILVLVRQSKLTIQAQVESG